MGNFNNRIDNRNIFDNWDNFNACSTNIHFHSRSRYKCLAPHVIQFTLQHGPPCLYTHAIHFTLRHNLQQFLPYHAYVIRFHLRTQSTWNCSTRYTFHFRALSTMSFSTCSSTYHTFLLPNTVYRLKCHNLLYLINLLSVLWLYMYLGAYVLIYHISNLFLKGR